MHNSKKIVLVGHFGVGKSSLIRRYVKNTFSDDYLVTIGVHIVKKTVQIGNDELTLIIWDIEGKEDMQKLRPSFLLGTSGFMYVFDATRSSTYINLLAEINFIETHYPKINLVTVANKLDILDKNTFEKIKEKHKLRVDYYASAKTGENVELIFNAIAKNLIK